MSLSLSGPEWDPIEAYAQSHGVSFSLAVRELLAMSVSTAQPLDAAMAEHMRSARARATQIAFRAVGNAVRLAYEELRVKALEEGVNVEDGA